MKFEDAPAARVVSFELAVGLVALTDDSANAISGMTTQRAKFSHLSAGNDLLSMEPRFPALPLEQYLQGRLNAITGSDHQIHGHSNPSLIISQFVTPLQDSFLAAVL